jgi:very-short-patch-repair endonuclease
VEKTVLFVAEKTAALDVVHRRLKEHGLGDCCVELHSNKAERRRMLSQLEASWKRRARPANDDWLEVSERLQVRRDELNAYVAAIHATHANGWTVYDAMGLSVRDRSLPTVQLDWPRKRSHERADFAALEQCVEDLSIAWSAMPNDVNLGRVSASDWSMGWESDFLSCCEDLKQSSADLSDSVQKLSASLGLPLGDDIDAKQFQSVYRFTKELAADQLPASELLLHEDLDSLTALLNTRGQLLNQHESAELELESAVTALATMLGSEGISEVPESRRPALYRLANAIVRGDLPPDALVFHEEFDALPDQLRSRKELLEARDESQRALAARQFDPSLVARINLEEIESSWLKARGSFWPLSALRSKTVVKKLKSYMNASGEPNPELDLALLREEQERICSLNENLASLGLPDDLQSVVREDPTGLDSSQQAARILRNKIAETGVSLASLAKASAGSLETVRATAKRLYPPGRTVEKVKVSLRENLESLGLTDELAGKVSNDASALDLELEASGRIRKASEAIGISNENLKRVLHASDAERTKDALEFRRNAKAFTTAWQSYAKLGGTTPASTETIRMASDAREQAAHVLDNRQLLKRWVMWTAATKRAKQLELDVFCDSLVSGKSEPRVLREQFRLAYAQWWLPVAVDESDSLRTFGRVQHEEAIREFRRLDELAREASAPRAKQAIYHDLPNSNDVPRKSELGLLRHQMGLKRPSKSIREVISGMPTSFGKLAPCLMMSPLSIAQYLPADQETFDVVVFDEASQIPTWDAIGAIARGKQTIVVGDPKQLPPTNFFGKTEDDDENDDIDEYEKDLESILDEAQASGLPTLQLNWHYRSRHESLIAFSNWNYYNNELVTFPSAHSDERGVSLTHVANGIYDRGKSRTNRAEADAIVADLVDRMKRCMAKPEDERLTYGVVTFNSQQQTLIQDLLDEALRRSPELEWFFSDDRIEATAVKNLENVQGDERDVMYFSITFGKDIAGKFPVDFGALNRTGGERRLNVAVTRARVALRVYASFLPDELRAERSGARGVHDLKSFLDYAHRGFQSLAEQNDGSVGDYESPFEEAVAKAMMDRGWNVEPQIGVSGFRVDLGVIHPDRPGTYLAGVECDGATYHRSAVARDRDKTRQLVLENLGWNIARVWSTDWWYDPVSAIEKLQEELERLLKASNEERPDRLVDTTKTELATDSLSNETILTDDSDSGDRTTKLQQLPESIAPPEERPATTEGSLLAVGESEHTSQSEAIVCRGVNDEPVPSDQNVYRPVVLVDATDRQAEFFDEGYTETIRQIALDVVSAEGPIRDDLVAKRIARAHGFARTGAKIKQRVSATIPELTITKETVGNFLWPAGKVEQSVPFRYAKSADDRRSLDDVPIQELLGLIRANGNLLASEDPGLAFAREIGLARLSKSARERIEAAIELANGNDDS